MEGDKEVLVETEQKMSKAQMKKLEKQKEKEQQKELNQQKTKQLQESKEEQDYSVDSYGEYDIYGSLGKEQILHKISEVDLSLKEKNIWIRGRVSNIRGKGNLAFLVIRDNMFNVQCVASKSQQVSKQMLKFINNISKESIIDIQAQVIQPQDIIQSCTQKQVELNILKLFVLSRSTPNLPFQLEDASRAMDLGDELDNGGDWDNGGDERDNGGDNGGDQRDEATKDVKDANKQIKVGMKTRLDNRVMDLRTVGKQGIFRVQSMVCQLFREFLYTQEFIEIHTPKMLGGTSEGGSNVFKVNYFKQEGCLAQSPQLYKQMCVQGDLKRVFEIGPVFRAENSFTHRHMCEFTGLDFEMVIEHSYMELIDIICRLFCHIFNGLETRMQNELQNIRAQYPSEVFKVSNPIPVITFEEGIQMLKDNNINWDLYEDLSTTVEKQLGEIVKRKYDSDFYVLHRYPKQARPFYTMLDKHDNRWTASYDVFMRGEEIISGAQRVHDPIVLAERALQSGIPPHTIQGYIDSFKLGAHPHGGCGVGLERVVMLYCNLKNIRNSSLFPRDPKRLTP